MITDKEYFQLSGQILNNLGVADMILCNVFRVTTQLESEMAGAIYFTLESFYQRKSMLLRAIDKSDKFPKDLIEQLGEILNRLGKSNSKRNEYAHHLPLLGDDGNMYRFNPRSNKLIPLKRTDIETDLNNSQDRGHELMSFWNDLCKQTGEPPELRS